MTNEQLDETERLYVSSPEPETMHGEIPALIAEVRRLRGWTAPGAQRDHGGEVAAPVPGWFGKCNAPEPGLGYPCAHNPGHLERGIPHATISGREWVDEPKAAPFARAFAELRAIAGREKAFELARWRARWIDEAHVARVMPPEMAGVPAVVERVNSDAMSALVALVPGRAGVVGKCERPFAEGLGMDLVEHRFCLCVVRAEPKADQEEARVAAQLLDYRDKGIEPPALQAYRERGEKPMEPKFKCQFCDGTGRLGGGEVCDACEPWEPKP